MFLEIDKIKDKLQALRHASGEDVNELCNDIESLLPQQTATHKQLQKSFGRALLGFDIYLWEWYVETGEVYWAPQAPGATQPEDFTFTLDWVLQQLPPHQATQLRQFLEHGLPADDEPFETDFNMNSSYSRMWLEVRGAVTSRDQIGKPVRVSGIARNIQRRFEVERQITLQRDAAILVSSMQSFDDTLEALFKTLLRIEGVDAGGCYLASEDQSGYDLIKTVNTPREFIDTVQHYNNDHPLVQIAQQNRIWSSGKGESIDMSDEMLRLTGFTAGAVSPFFQHDRLLGFFILVSCSVDRLSPFAINLIESLTVVAGHAIMRAVAEQALRDSEEKHRSLTNNVNAAIFRTTPGRHGSFLEVNDTFLRMFGLKSREELAEKNVSDFYADPSERKRLNDLLLKQDFLRDAELQVRKASGETFWVTLNATTIRDDAGAARFFDGVMIDVTAHKEAAQVLQESEEKFRTISENSLMCILIIHRNRVAYANRKFFEHSLYTPAEVASWKENEFFKMVHPEYREKMIEQARKKLMGNTDVIPSYIFKAIRKDKKVAWMDLYSDTIPYRGERALMITLVDIDERVIAQSQLAGSEKRFRELFEKNGAVMCLVSPETGKIYSANQAMQQMHGYSRQELEQMYLQDLTIDESGKQMPRDSKLTFSKQSISKHKASDGRVLSVEIRFSEIEQDGELLQFAIITDVTDKLRMEEEIAKRQKLDAIGQLAGGIAHDFNNILMAILGNISLLKHDTDDPEASQTYISNAEKGIQRAKKLANQLLTFSKGGAPIRETASVHDLLTESTRFMMHGSDIATNLDLPDDLLSVRVDTGQINQVVQNILLNAQQSMRKGGTITISACNDVVSEKRPNGLESGEYVRVSIQDEGVGIEAEARKRVFDPYYTTRKSGSGLGLSIVYSIIKRHGGVIQLESETGVGSTFHFWLPAVHTKAPRKTLSKETVHGQGVVLFMDDETMVRETAGEFLRYLGYDVHFAANGEQAIEKYKLSQQSDKPIDLVILDLTIPGGMGAKATIRALQKLDPKVKGVVVSGFSQDRIMRDYQSAGFKGAISKPFVLSEFSQMIKQAMDD